MLQWLAAPRFLVSSWSGYGRSVKFTRSWVFFFSPGYFGFLPHTKDVRVGLIRDSSLAVGVSDGMTESLCVGPVIGFPHARSYFAPLPLRAEIRSPAPPGTLFNMKVQKVDE